MQDTLILRKMTGSQTPYWQYQGLDRKSYSIFKCASCVYSRDTRPVAYMEDQIIRCSHYSLEFYLNLLPLTTCDRGWLIFWSHNLSFFCYRQNSSSFQNFMTSWYFGLNSSHFFELLVAHFEAQHVSVACKFNWLFNIQYQFYSHDKRPLNLSPS